MNDQFYASMERMFASIIEMINQQETRDIFDEFEDRLVGILENTADLGWGFHENLTDIFYEVAWQRTVED